MRRCFTIYDIEALSNTVHSTVSRIEPLYLTAMHIRYDRSPDDCLAVRVCPFDEEAHYVEILLLGYYADGKRCWLPPEVRRCSLAPCGTAEACALKQATEIAGRIARRLQTVDDPEQALLAMGIRGEAGMA